MITESEVVGLLRHHPVDAYQFTASTWRQMSPILQSLKRRHIVSTRKALVPGGISGMLRVTEWYLR